MYLIFVLVLAEAMIVGFQKSSLKSLLSFSKSTQWSILSWTFNIAIIWIADLYCPIIVGQFSIPFLKIAEFDSAVSILMIFIFYDFVNYWRHRLLHTFDVFWQTHELHHSATHVDIFLDSRSHILENLIGLFRNGIIGNLFGVFLFGAPIMICRRVIDVLSHSRIDTRFGRYIGEIIVSPRFHHLHHDMNYHNKNYGNVFTIWDKMFGTYVPPNISIYDMKPGLLVNEYVDGGFLRVYIGTFSKVATLLLMPFRRLNISVSR